MTRNAARALGVSDSGMLRPGLRADLALWDVAHPAELAYRIGFNPCTAVFLEDKSHDYSDLGRLRWLSLNKFGVAMMLLPAFRHQGANEAAAAFVSKAAAGGVAVYGVNTGFGKLANVPIAEDQTATLQRNLVLSHCCGVGETLEAPTTRMMMVLKLLSLGRGASGVAWTTVDLITEMLNKRVLPQIPVQGSVGASGDLARLHIWPQ